ncbi:hypothetical protein Tsp_09495 [Trichinella spiralis]|uniref:hypothetical protein n=1 Tax=Trichinella spiralis TaxID=6334 RepID=UPI0001EFD751|nr:hypothetical protein Tsp_09495 [Trichinella spiralis]
MFSLTTRLLFAQNTPLRGKMQCKPTSRLLFTCWSPAAHFYSFCFGKAYCLRQTFHFRFYQKFISSLFSKAMSNSKQEEKAKVNQSQDELCVKMNTCLKRRMIKTFLLEEHFIISFFFLHFIRISAAAMSSTHSSKNAAAYKQICEKLKCVLQYFYQQITGKINGLHNVQKAAAIEQPRPFP